MCRAFWRTEVTCQCQPRTHRRCVHAHTLITVIKAGYKADFDVGAHRDPVGSFAWASSCSILLKSPNDKHKGTHKHNAHGHRHGHVEHHNELIDQRLSRWCWPPHLSNYTRQPKHKVLPESTMAPPHLYPTTKSHQFVEIGRSTII